MRDPKRYHEGFTLAEMLVAVGIFMLIASAFLIRNSQFHSATLLQTTAYEVALAIREAQVFGLSVREVPGVTGEEFNLSYGVVFDSAQSSGDNTQFYLGAEMDTCPAGPSDPGPGCGQINDDERIKTFKLNRGYSIETICGSTDTQGECAGTQTKEVSIFFTRPDPEAYIERVEVGGQQLVYVEVHVASPNGTIKKVSVSNTGQISVFD